MFLALWLSISVTTTHLCHRLCVNKIALFQWNFIYCSYPLIFLIRIQLVFVAIINKQGVFESWELRICNQKCPAPIQIDFWKWERYEIELVTWTMTGEDIISYRAAVACVGAFYEKMGRMLGSAFPETVNNLLKSLKSAEVSFITNI